MVIDSTMISSQLRFTARNSFTTTRVWTTATASECAATSGCWWFKISNRSPGILFPLPSRYREISVILVSDLQFLAPASGMFALICGVMGFLFSNSAGVTWASKALLSVKDRKVVMNFNSFWGTRIFHPHF